MYKYLWLSALLLLSLSLPALTCYDIQFTTNSNGNSPYTGQTVTVQGIVSGINYSGNKYFISDPAGGPCLFHALYQDGGRDLRSGYCSERDHP